MTLDIRRSLIVEDNAIIAMDCEDMLRELGAEVVEICPTVKQALAYLSNNTVNFAMLDVNLGSETSDPIATQLAKQGTPFIFATGHEDIPEVASAFAKATVIQKPYTAHIISEALKTLDVG